MAQESDLCALKRGHIILRHVVFFEGQKTGMMPC